ncbi:hypothetical protein Pelo_9724 [Pelomyxa schiedti]|nr:hypothetical protein Pelo_9724 [Pelomyxa schiedti]
MVHLAPQMFTNNYAIEGDLWGFGMLVAEMINGDIVDSTLDNLPYNMQANFLGEAMSTLSPPDLAEVRRLCSEAGESAIAHCLSRRKAALDAVKYFTHSPESPLFTSCGTALPETAGDLVFIVVQSCLSILERNRLSFSVIVRLLYCCCAVILSPNCATQDQVDENITRWLSSLAPTIASIEGSLPPNGNLSYLSETRWFPPPFNPFPGTPPYPDDPDAEKKKNQPPNDGAS